MSFNPNDSINQGNYEEYFILYMDNELSASQKAMVDEFVSLHPHLADELEMLLSTKLPVEEISFGGKEELFSSSMKLTVVDERLLLYIDNELPAAEQKALEKKISVDKDYALQHALLQQTKLDAGEAVPHPNKKELYRHERKTVPFGFWLRIAAAVVLLLLGSLFYWQSNRRAVGDGDNGVAITTAPSKKASPSADVKTPAASSEINQPAVLPKQEAVAAQSPVRKSVTKEEKEKIAPRQNIVEENTGVVDANQVPANRKRDVIRFDVNQLTQPVVGDAVALNNTITTPAVTSALAERTTTYEDAPETAGSDGDFKETKKTPARGFFRKVSRFIERKAGIGTVNADNELLIGAVALKLK